jgi:UDP-N-acetylmuramate dehydrogenase
MQHSPLLKLLRQDQLLFDEPLKSHTSFRIGGPADVMALPENTKELSAVLSFCLSEGIRHMVMGNGSNLLFSDKGYRGAIIKLAKNMSGIEAKGEELRAQSGASLASLAARACSLGLSGLEFASGIPGTLGGAIFMNAGAYGGEMKDVFLSAEVVMSNGTIGSFEAPQMRFGYRTSVLQENGGIAARVSLILKPGVKEEIKAKMEDLNQRRREKQPLEFPSAGSTFKRPEGHFAGKLIMDSGLAGYSIGGAQVSMKHCGFVVGNTSASADDVLRLIEHVQSEVYKRFNVLLEPEVKIIPEK